MKNKFWTLRYALINILYFAAYCGLHAYSSVFLLDRGFSNTAIGLLLASANILSVIIQPMIAGLIDKPGNRLSNRNVTIVASVLVIAGSLMLLKAENKAAVFIIYVLIYMVQMAYQPLIIAMNFEYAKVGCDIKFGLARGLGSAGFAIASAILGPIVERRGVRVLIFTDVAVLLLLILTVFFFRKPEEESGEAPKLRDSAESAAKPHNNIFEFTRLYPRFMLMLAGVVCLFFAHNAINDFLIQIVRDLGGTETQMGYGNFLQAILELPTMAVAGILVKKFGTKPLIVFSSIFFTIKVATLVLAQGIPGMYLSESFQLFAYAVLIPVCAYYVSESLEELDQVKGQAFVNCAVTVGGVFSNLFCGRMLDVYGSKTMLFVGCIVSVIGVVLIVTALYGKSLKKAEIM